jgi:hypothetical protein
MGFAFGFIGLTHRSRVFARLLKILGKPSTFNHDQACYPITTMGRFRAYPCLSVDPMPVV